MTNDTHDPRLQPPTGTAAAAPPPPPYAAAPPRRTDLPYKQPWLAGFLSGVFPGLGQVYVGYYRNGIVLAAIFIGLITALANGVQNLEPLFGMALAFAWFYGIVDAARRAQAVNRALDGIGNQPLPEDLALPSGGGSLAGGAVLVALGLLLFLNLNFGLSLEWLEDVWPLGLVGLGAWLMWKARSDKKADPGNP